MHSGVIQILDWFTISHNNHVPKLCNVSCNTIYRCSVSLHCLTFNQVKDDYTSASNAIAMLDMAMCKFGEEALAKMDGALHDAIFIIPEQICNSCIHHVYLV